MREILENKRKEVESLYAKHSECRGGVFEKALASPDLSVIAEVKRKSPSSGSINHILNPVELVNCYNEGGAAAISILTDEKGFGGHCKDLTEIRSHYPEQVILRKEFIVDPIQIAETAQLEANAVLLIVTILGNRIREYLHLCEAYGLDALVEVHNEKELEVALNAGSRIIGVNNRNLHTFEVDLQVSEHLAPLIPQTVLKVAESGIRSPDDAIKMFSHGYDGVLIGEALVRSSSPQQFIKRIRDAC